jgi:prepilin-type N-terminal cleavage/methylation domain-containing protein/prepilin-type processing-associated H-X9-DG protein
MKLTRGCRQVLSHGFTLLELLVVIVIIAGLAAIAFPVTDRVMQRARAASCMNNLRNLGAALNLYLADHNNFMPALVTARSDSSSSDAAIDTTLNAYTSSRDVFRCPADTKQLWQSSGTSYLWDSLLNGQNVTQLEFFGMVTNSSHIPLISDKENFHKYQDVQVNILYADGHVAKEIQFTVNGK